MARSKDPDKPSRLSQIRQVYRLTHEQDPRLPLVMAGPGVAVLTVLVVVGVLTGQPVLFSILGVLSGALTASMVFGRRSQRVVFEKFEGQRGAGAGILQGMRGDWRVTPAVQVTRAQDMVHRAIGRPGVVLVGEGGSAARVDQLLVQERRRIARVLPDTPVYEFQVGDAEGQLSLKDLQRRLLRLPRNLKPKEVDEIEVRLKALRDSPLPIPKGPIPKGGRIPRRMR